MTTTSNRMSIPMFFVFGCLLLALGCPNGFAQGHGTPDPAGIPVLQGMRVQIDGLDQEFVALTGIIQPEDLPQLVRLADELVRIDAQFAVAAVGDGTPDPGATTLNQVLLGVRAETVSLRDHVGSVVGKVRENPSFAAITKVLQ